MRPVPDTDTLTAPVGVAVEGSGGLLLEIDGQIVPNYDATIVPFDEGDVVTGKVVRIDKDEVLVDIGYKSEGVILSNELSIRKSANPYDEVEMGEEVDALVLTKEDQDGRLILSKKRARFERAWRRIEAAADSGLPVEGQVIEVVKGGLIIDLGVRGFLPPTGSPMSTTDLQPTATIVEGSDGLLLLIDGQIVPNYDATLQPFEEGDVVTGHVVRIDKDEVLVDIGYKSEGVILSNELSIRKSADPFEEVEMGEEVDALVL
ncbi:MAG: small subunit ribosomal protein, partial [Thermoleophilaceae bacterium]|nr:small subunit ribosomal protein [Thermoleophilaceae bacterium]